MSLPRVLALSALVLASWSAAAGAYPNVQVNGQDNRPQETSIAINPTRVGNVLGSAQFPSSSACRAYPTFDGGVTWGDQQLPGQYELGDPSVVFDLEGYAYYTYIGTFSHSGIFINRSTDGGASWRAQAVPAIEHASGQPFEDKPYSASDWTTPSPYHGRLYSSWTQFDQYGSPSPSDSSRILCARSTNRGDTFLAPVRVSDRGGDAVDSDETVEGAVPAVGPDGVVYIAWAGPRGLEFDRSTNGGASFGVDRVISDQPGGWDFQVPGIFRCNGLPTTRTDISYGAHRGRVYVCWSDQRYGDTDVFLLFSDNGGVSWGPRIRVNDDPVENGRDQFFPWIDVDPVTGTVYVVFYDRRQYTDTATDVYLAVSTDGGASFANERISAVPFVPDPGVFFGDYIGISAYGGTVRPLWVRMDNGRTSLWTALINPNPAGVWVSADPSRSAASWGGAVAAGGLAIRPNPVRGGAEIVFRAIDGRPRALRIFDAQGRVVRGLDLAAPGAIARGGAAPGGAAGSMGVFSIAWDGRDDAGRALPSGVYFLGDPGRARTGPVRFVVLR